MNAMKAINPGIHELEEKVYRALPYINKSGLDKVRKSPAHFRFSIENPQAPTLPMTLGNATHFGVFQPELLYRHYFARPEGIDGRTKEGKEKLSELGKQHAGKIMLSSDDFGTVEGIMRAVRGHKLASQLISGGRAEMTAIAEDPETGAMCKARPDYMREDDILLDLKTTTEAGFFAFQRSVKAFRYHVQAAFYLDTVNRALGHEQYKRFILVVVEKEAPYGVVLYELDPEAIRIGRLEYRADLETYANCLKTNSWPSYPESLLTMTVPVYE